VPENKAPKRKKVFKTTLDLITRSLDETSLQIKESVKSIPETLKSLRGALEQQAETKKESEDAIHSLAEDAKLELRELRRVIEAEAPEINPLPSPTEQEDAMALESAPDVHVQKPGIFGGFFGSR